MHNTGFAAQTHLPSWLSWMPSGEWTATLTRLGVALIGLILILALIVCCVNPLGRHFAVSAVTNVSNISGQYVLGGGEASPPQRGEEDASDLV